MPTKKVFVAKPDKRRDVAEIRRSVMARTKKSRAYLAQH